MFNFQSTVNYCNCVFYTLYAIPIEWNPVWIIFEEVIYNQIRNVCSQSKPQYRKVLLSALQNVPLSVPNIVVGGVDILVGTALLPSFSFENTNFQTGQPFSCPRLFGDTMRPPDGRQCQVLIHLAWLLMSDQISKAALVKNIWW